MANFAPPIARDGFLYQGQLFADVGNLNRHLRASEAELTALLRPESSTGTSQKDQVGHYYIAQLKHYGLPPTKDKNAAKVRLLNALNQGKLVVPRDVKKLETALKKEYDAANKRAKAELKGKAPISEAETTTPAKKRKRDDQDIATNGASSTTKKARTPASRKSVDDATATNSATSTSKKAKAPARRKKDEEDATTNSASPITSKKSKTPARDKTAKSQAATPRTQRSASKATPRKTTPASRAKKETPKAGSASMKGIYYVSVPTIKDTWPALAATPKSLKMILCPDGEVMWGSYDLGLFSGVIRFNLDPQKDHLRFVWRGTDASGGDNLKFTTGLGDLRFPEDNRITGTFYNLYGYRCGFEGKLQAGPRTCPRDVASFENEWEDYGTTNNWFGQPPIRIPDGERPPPGMNVARSSAINAMRPAEPRYLPDDSTQESSSESSGEKTSTKGKQPTVKNKQSAEKNKRPKETSNQPSPQHQQPSTDRPVNGSGRRASIIKHEDDYYNSSPTALASTYDPTDISQITGVYDVHCPSIEDNWLDSQNNLRLLVSRDGRTSRTWGGFAWGPFFGVIQMNPGPSDYSTQPVSLGWRARDGETGSIRFGRGCNGAMEFPEPNIIQGQLFNLYGDVMEFWGCRRPGPKNCGHAPSSFEEEWDSFPSEVYGDRRGSESEAELYDRHGNLNPRGRYSALLERSLRN